MVRQNSEVTLRLRISPSNTSAALFLPLCLNRSLCSYQPTSSTSLKVASSMTASAFRILSASSSVKILRGFTGGICFLSTWVVSVFGGGFASPFVKRRLEVTSGISGVGGFSGAGLLSTTGFGGGVTGRWILASETFGEGSLVEGPRILAKDMGLFARSGFCGTASGRP